MQEGKGKKSKKNSEEAKQEYFAIGSADKQDACGYTKTPLPLVLGYLDLGDECKLTYMGLLSYAFGKDVCWPSAHTIADDLGYHVATIYRHLEELAKRGLIRRESQYEEMPFGGRGEYIRTNTHILGIHLLEAERAHSLISSIEKTSGRGILFEYENRSRRAGDVFVNNVFIRGYKSLSPGSKITFVFINYLASNRIRMCMADIAKVLNKGTSSVRRHFVELETASLIRREIFKSEAGKKVAKGDLLNRILIKDFSSGELDAYIMKYNPQHLVPLTDANDPYAGTTCVLTDANDPEDIQHLVPLTDATEEPECSQMRLFSAHECEQNNITNVEETVNNVIEKSNHAPHMRIDNGIKNPKAKKRGRVSFKKDIPEEVVEEIKGFVETEICAFLDDHGSLNNYVFLAEVCYDNGADYCQVIWRAKSLFKYERTEGKIKDERRYFNALLRKVMADEYNIDIPRVGKD